MFLEPSVVRKATGLDLFLTDVFLIIFIALLWTPFNRTMSCEEDPRAGHCTPSDSPSKWSRGGIPHPSTMEAVISCHAES